MGAGDGAAEQARVASERVKRLRRQLANAEQAERSWAAGAAGEALVAERLDRLGPHGWLVLHDVRWPGRPKANIDHILVGPGGIVVVDAKNWSGTVEVRNSALKQNGYSREREAEGVLQQCAAVAVLLQPQHRQMVRGVLCLVGQPAVEGTTASGVGVLGLDRVTAAVEGLPAVLDSSTAELIYYFLKGQLAAGASPELLLTCHMQQPAAPGVYLNQWKANAGSRRQTTTGHAPKSKRPAKKPGCLGTVLRLVMLFVVFSMIMSFVTNAMQSPAEPPSSPSVTILPRPAP